MKGAFFLFVVALVLIALFGCESIAADGPYQARVIRVLDGDTLEIEAQLWPGLTMRSNLRLAGINAPELRGGKPCETQAAKRATEFVREWIQSREGVMVVIIADRDKYGRALGRLYIAGVDLGEELVKAGHAKPYAGGKRGAWC